MEIDSEEGFIVPPIFYATTRRPQKDGEYPFYSKERNSFISLGLANLGVQRGGFSSEEIDLSITSIQELGRIPCLNNSDDGLKRIDNREDLFLDELNRKINASENKDIVLFVHGYNIDFVEPVLMTNAFRHYTSMDTTFISYGWPSLDSVTSYGPDLDSIEVDTLYFRRFLNLLANESSAQKIHIIAFSAGTRLVTRALYQWSLTKYEMDSDAYWEDSIGNVVLTASDMDRQLFANYINDGLMNWIDSLQIYVSNNDIPLGSSRIYLNYPRLGQTLSSKGDNIYYYRNQSSSNRIFFIDVSLAEGNRTYGGHGYLLHSSQVRRDIIHALLEESNPFARGLLPHNEIPLLWCFPGQ